MGAYQGPQTPPSQGYESLTRKPATSFSVNQVPAPTEFYVTDDSQLQLRLFGPVSGSTFQLTYRLLLSSTGEVVTFQQQITYPVGGSIVVSLFKLQEGFLLDVTIDTTLGSYTRGNVFAVIEVLRGSGTDLKIDRVLVADYIVGNQSIGFPHGTLRQSVDGAGSQFALTNGAFTAGTEAIVATIPLQRFKPKSIVIVLVTSAAVANRTPELRISNTTGTFARIPIVGNIAASQTTVLCYTNTGIAPVLNNGVMLLPIPQDVLLVAGGVIQTVTGNLQAGDQYTSMVVEGESWVLG